MKPPPPEECDLPLHLIIAALLMLMLTSCSTYYADRSETEDGRKLDREFWVQLGGKGGFHRDSDGTITASADNEKSFRDAALATTTMVVSNIQAGVEKARSADQTKVATTGIIETETTNRASIEAASSTAQSVGNNPEANVGALEGVRRIFR